MDVYDTQENTAQERSEEKCGQGVGVGVAGSTKVSGAGMA